MHGSRYTIICRNEAQDCYDKALSYCPNGYVVQNRVRGVRIGDDQTEYTVIVRCKIKY